MDIWIERLTFQIFCNDWSLHVLRNPSAMLQRTDSLSNPKEIDALMKITTKKILHLKLRSTQEWEPPREIAAFKEDGTDLVLLDTNNREVARFAAGEFEEWKVEGHAIIEP